MEDKYPRITKTQFDIWIDNAVTKTFLQAIEFSREQLADIMWQGAFVDSSNNDLSMNKWHSAFGHRHGLAEAADPLGVLKKHELLEEEAKK